MTLCVIDGGHCVCQPQDGVFCPNAKTDADRCKVAKAYRDIPWDDAQEAGAREPVVDSAMLDRALRRSAKVIHPPTTGAIEALERDAARYRWLRQHWIEIYAEPPRSDSVTMNGSGNVLDERIDAALAPPSL
jgi:hypothetical protein